MTGTRDAVVIGAGHNGLVAANLLADEGWSVTVLEAAPQPGGAVRSAEVTAPGFVSDLYSAFYPLGAGSPVMRRLDLGSYGLRWAHAPLVLTHVLPDGRSVSLSRDVDETAASVETFAPGDGDAWRATFAEWQRVSPGLIGSLFRPFPPVRAGLGLARALGVADGLRFARFALLPVRRFGEERFGGEGARLLFAGNALHSDVGPEGAGSAVLGWLLAMLGQDVGFPVPEGGAERLVDALVARLRARGGEVECGVRVDRVLVSGGRAVGVRTAGGDVLGARKAVLADVDAPSLFRRLVGEEHLPGRFVEDLDRFQWDNATLKVDWALSAPVPWTAPDARRAGTVHLGVDLDGLTDYAADLATGREPEHPFLLFGQMTTADPTRSPAGTEVAWAYTHLPRGLSSPSSAAADASSDFVRRHVERVEAAVERHAPGFRDLVVGRYVQGPADLQAADRNLDDGAVNAGTASLHQQLFFRPVPGLGRPDTPVDRLFLAGSSAHPGGGVHGAPGANAARAALVRAGVAGPVYAAGIRGANKILYRPHREVRGARHRPSR